MRALIRNNAALGLTIRTTLADQTPFGWIGRDFELWLKTRASRAALPILQCTTTNGMLYAVGPSDLFWNIPTATMKTLKPRSYFWDLLEVLDSGELGYVMGGLLPVYQGITETP